MSDQMIVVSEKHGEKHKEVEQREAHLQQKRQLLTLFAGIDADNDGFISKEEWKGMLRDEDMCESICLAANVEKEELMNLFEWLTEDIEGSDVPTAAMKRRKARGLRYDQFIRHLQVDATPADKRSVLHMMARMREIEDLVKDMHGV